MNHAEQPQMHIEENQQEIFNEVGTIPDAFQIIDGMPVMLINKETKGWQPRLQFDLHDGKIDEGTMDLIHKLQEENEVKIGLPHNGTPENARVILYR